MNWPRLSLKDARFRGWLAAGILGLLVLSLLWPLAVSRDARHLTAYASGDQDLSRLHDELHGAVGDVRATFGGPHDLAGLDPTRTVLFVVGAERRYDPSEAQEVVAFLRAGGAVVLADDTGFGSDVAREAGFAFSSQHVLDTVNYHGDARLAVATATMDGQSYRLLFNTPSAIVALSNAADHDVIAQSSSAKYPDGSYLDTKGSGQIDINDQPGPFPLVVRTHVGAGTLVLVSNAGVFMNAQMGVADDDNARFAHALATTLLPNGGTAVIDESRHAAVWWLAPWGDPVRLLARATGGVATPFLLVGALVLATLAAWRSTRSTDDWSRHEFDASRLQPVPPHVRPDAARAQRMARVRISERFNIPLEQVAAMTTEDLLALTGDRTLTDAASGAADPGPFFKTYAPPTESTP